MTYWLVNSGTTEAPWDGDLRCRYEAWTVQNGDVQMFPWRPARMIPGDVLIHRAVASPGQRLIAVGEVLSQPEPSGHKRWPWQVRRRLTAVCPSLEVGPRLSQIGESSRGLRVMKALSDDHGRLAVDLIARAV